MGQNIVDKNHATLEKKLQDHPVFIPTDVDHYETTDEICSCIVCLEICEPTPVRLLGPLVPGIERRLGVRISLPEFSQPATTDHSHKDRPILADSSILHSTSRKPKMQ